MALFVTHFNFTPAPQSSADTLCYPGCQGAQRAADASSKTLTNSLAGPSACSPPVCPAFLFPPRSWLAREEEKHPVADIWAELLPSWSRCPSRGSLGRAGQAELQSSGVTLPTAHVWVAGCSRGQMDFAAPKASGLRPLCLSHPHALLHSEGGCVCVRVKRWLQVLGSC